MLQLNDGLLTIYETLPDKSKGGKPVLKLGASRPFWFQYLGVGSKDYWESKQQEVEIEARVRIRQCKKVSSQSVVMINKKLYQVGRVFHGLDKTGIPITDMNLERIEQIYDIDGI